MSEQTIASPREVGDNFVDSKIDAVCFLRYGWFDGFYLRAYRGKELLFERQKDKNVLEDRALISDIANRFLAMGVCKKMSEGRLLVLKAWMDFEKFYNTTLKSQVESKNSVISDVNAVCDVISDTNDKDQSLYYLESMETNALKPTIGILTTIDHSKLRSVDHEQVKDIGTVYYLGIQVPKKTPIFNDKGQLEGYEIKKQLVLLYGYTIKQNKFHLSSEVTPKLHKTLNIKLPAGEDSKSRWSLTKAKEWIDNPDSSVKSAKELFESIKQEFKKYVWFDEEQYYNILPLWVLGTYFFPLFTTFPYVNLWGMKNTGKSKVMRLSSILSFNSEVFVNMSVASLFRIVDQNSPTLFIDEAENLWKDNQKKEDDTSEIVALLNAGWMKGNQVPRVEKVDGKQTILRFDVYCPKMLASIQGLKGALESRCIRVVMLRPTGEPSSQLWMSDDDPKLLEIRNNIYPFVLNSWGVVKAYYDGEGSQVKNEFGLDNRDWQIWKPLLAIASLISPELVKEVGNWAFQECDKNKEDDIVEDDWDSNIVKAISGLVKESKLYYVSDIKAAVDAFYIERTVLDSSGKEVILYRKDRPSGKYIGRFFLRMGLGKYKHRGGAGKRGYMLSESVLKKIFGWRMLNTKNNVTNDSKGPNGSLEGDQLKKALIANIHQTVPLGKSMSYQDIESHLKEHFTFDKDLFDECLSIVLSDGRLAESRPQVYTRVDG